jgi:hypothetical protein
MQTEKPDLDSTVRDNMASLRKTSLIAPCGMNCGICLGYLREKDKCPGCRGIDRNKPDYCVRCRIKNCGRIQNVKPGFCFQCEKFPCARLKQLDKRYRTRYNMSMLENLETIRELGIRQFAANEKVRWTCPECGGTICVHNRYCYSCGQRQ